jgi:hypothetical protein
MKRFISAAAILFLLAAGSIFAQNLLNHQVKVATGPGNVRWSQCAFSPDGVLHVVYATADSEAAGNGVWYVKYDGTTASTPYNVLDSEYASGLRPSISINPRGQICIAWGEANTDSVFMRTGNSANGYWNPIEQVADGYGYYETWNAQDSAGNIYVTWYGEYGGGAWCRAKINGVWEEPEHMGFGTGKQSCIICAPDDTAWLGWREKFDGGYHMYYSRRTPTTGWTEPKLLPIVGEPSHPFFAVSPSNEVYLASGEITVEDESFQEIWIVRLNETTNPMEPVLPNIMQHYPVIACDANGKLHLIMQIGGGDFGDGIKYTNKISGQWVPWQTIPAGLPKIGGLSCDPYGNTAVCWSSIDTRSGNADIYVNSLNLIRPQFFEPPVSLGIEISMTGVRRTPGIEYHLSWQANPKNDDAFLKGYKIYMKEGDADWAPVTQVVPATKSVTLNFSDRTKRRKFSIVTVAAGGAESTPVIFGQ